jgi:hypothetical protein
VKFDAEFIPDIGTNDVYLWGEAPNFGRVRFSIDSVILVDHLGVRNPVHRENNLAHCKAKRERVERACRRAFSRRRANRVSLAAIDFAYKGASPTVLTLHRKEVPRLLDSRFSRLRYEESLRSGPVTQLQLEEELNRIWSHHIRPRPTHKTISPFQNGAWRVRDSCCAAMVRGAESTLTSASWPHVSHVAETNRTPFAFIFASVIGGP